MTDRLTRTQLQTLAGELRAQKAVLLAEAQAALDTVRAVPGAGPDSAGDNVDLAATAELRATSGQVVGRCRGAIRAIDEALQRIADHRYGLCEDCGAPIGYRRLRARPFARRCIDCRALLERHPAP